MFEWLEQEIAAVKTPRFHLVDGPADTKLRNAIDGSALPFPVGYKEFVLRFGDARLYRDSRIGYRLGVYAGPREALLDDGTRIFHLGFHAGASVYVKLQRSTRLPIFEYEDGTEDEVALGFEEWLRDSCALARKQYGKRKWAEILRGPRPFTAEEEVVLETRRRIRWRVLGIDTEGNHMFEVKNLSAGRLRVLTIGLRSKDRRLNGATRLNIENVGPGETAILHAGCYRSLVPPTEMEAFELPEPRPEDRDYYHELQSTPKRAAL